MVGVKNPHAPLLKGLVMADDLTPEQKKEAKEKARAAALAKRIKSSNEKVKSYQKLIDNALSSITGYKFQQHLGTDPSLEELNNRLKEIDAVFSGKSIKQLCNSITSAQNKIMDMEKKQIAGLINSAIGIKTKRKKVTDKQKKEAAYKAILASDEATQEQKDKAGDDLLKLLTS
tara:strand:- start:834 stop:1355 length:522 start_codon:yes stop_codon:yes gene_type:complete